MTAALSFQAVTLKLKTLLGRLREPPNRSHLIWVAVIFAVALTARAVWVAYAPADPIDGRHFDDTLFYYRSAVALAEGHGYVNIFTGAPTAQWPPGGSAVLAGVFRAFGSSVETAWGVNVVLGAFTCVALYAAGCLISGRRVGVPAGLTLALFPGHVFFSSLILSENLFTLLVVVAMALILFAGRSKNGGALRAVPAGLVVGAATLTRGQGLCLIIVAPLFWWLSGADWRRALRWTGVALLAALTIIVPWTVRNYFAMDSFVFISTNVGSDLYIGNNEEASGRFIWGIEYWIYEEYAGLPPAEREVVIGNRAFREGLRFMLTHPRQEAQLSGSKIRALYEDDEDGLRWINHPEVDKPVRSLPVIAGVADGFYFTVLALSAGGLVYWLRRRRSAVSLPLIVIAVFTAGQLLFFATPRFHVPMLPSFCLLAAAGIVAGVEYVRSRLRSPKQAAS